MKKYMDIENAKFDSIDLGGGITRRSNTGGFQVGDHIVIQEKFDGSCASIQVNSDTKELEAFSRKQKLDFNNTLSGFYNYVSDLDIDIPESYVVFGEWGRKNKILYNKSSYGIWYVFDIYDISKEEYLPQNEVEKFCNDNKLTYIHKLYDGEFISWDHVKTFLNSPIYGERQEGVVCKNQSRLSDKESRLPFYLKIVNEDFRESEKPKTIDPEKEAERNRAERLMNNIVTLNRVTKMIEKLVDEGVLGKELTASDMGVVARNLPKRVFEDCKKEENEVVQAAGEYAGKFCSSIVMKYARELIVGK